MKRLIFVGLWLCIAPIGFAQGEDLAKAARLGDLLTLEKAIAEEAEIDVPGPKSGLTPWQIAKIEGREEAATLLAEAGADTNRAFPPPEVLLDRHLSDHVVPGGPGCVLLVSRDGEVLFEKAYGFAKLDPETPMTVDAVSRIGSVSKQFTATAILLLEEEGKLSVEDPLSKYYPDFPNGDQITLHHLLTHTSGLKSYTDLPTFMGGVTEERTPEQMIASFREEKPEFEPGEDWKYCNSGYFLLGEIASQLAGKPYHEYLKEHVFEKLGMENTGAHRPGLDLPNEVEGLDRVAGEEALWETATNWHMSQAGGAGELYSKVRDLHRWNEGVFNGKVLQPETLERAFTPVNVESESSAMGALGKSYGYGWMIQDQRGLKRIDHSGGLHGFSSYLVRYPDHNLTVAVLVNSASPPQAFAPTQAGRFAAQLYLWEDMGPQPCFREDRSMKLEELKAFEGTYSFPIAIMRFRVREDRLEGRLGIQPWNPLKKTGEDTFALPEVDAVFAFKRNESGEVHHVTLKQQGLVLEGPRFEMPEAAELDDAAKEAFTGTYNLAIGAFVIRLDDKGRLMGRLASQPEIAYLPKAGDPDRLFCRDVRVELEFQRDEDGKVTSMKLHQNGMEFSGARAEPKE